MQENSATTNPKGYAIARIFPSLKDRKPSVQVRGTYPGQRNDCATLTIAAVAGL